MQNPLLASTSRSSPGTQTLVVVTPEVVVEVADPIWAVDSATLGPIWAVEADADPIWAVEADADPIWAVETAGVDVAADGPLCNK